jgi:hypothetical protein
MILLAAAAWPMLIEAGPKLLPRSNVATLAPLGWVTYGGLCIGLLVIGTLIGLGLARGQRKALRLFKVAVLVGMLIGLILVGLVIYANMPASSTPGRPGAPQASTLGAVPVLSTIILAMAALLPFIFGGFALSLATADEVTDYFQRTAQPEQAFQIPLTQHPVQHAAQEPAPDMMVETPAEEGMEVSAPAEPEAGSPGLAATIEHQPSDADLDAILEQETRLTIDANQAEEERQTRLAPKSKQTQMKPPDASEPPAE